ncbi:MAG: hypothetical protein ACOYXA_18605 [Bacteroidota bacterium]
MKFFHSRRFSYLHRLLGLVLALYFLNFSFDSPDAEPDHIAENLSHNDIESFYEFVLEELLGMENAVEEHDEQDHEDNRSLEFSKYYFNPFIIHSQLRFASSARCSWAPPVVFFTNSTLDVASPPPRS